MLRHQRRILAVDDDPQLLSMLCDILREDGYSLVDTAATGREALGLLRSQPPDLILLDVMLPDISGFDLMRTLRASMDVPVIFLTARGEGEDKFAAFHLGADDYLVKPFLPRELLFRIAAVLRRVYPETPERFALPACEVDLSRAAVLREDGEIPLTAKEHAILQKLFEAEGRIVTLGSLCETACGELYQGYESTLMTHIRHIREKIERDPSTPEALLTVRGLGYKLVRRKEENL